MNAPNPAMPPELPEASHYRVVVLAPTRRDREATLDLLQRAKLSCTACNGAEEARAEVASPVGAILMTDAAFSDPAFDKLLASLALQPPWSDVPIILLCQSGTAPPSAHRIMDMLRNVTLLERPTSSRTLLSSVQAAIRARARQYQLRDKFEEAKRTENQLRAVEMTLRDADHRKDLFLATLAHELRNPLAPIRTAAQILAVPTVDPEQLQWAKNVIQRQVSHMALLLDDLLDIARITQGKLELKKSRVTLSEVVASAIEAARPLIDRKEHSLTVTLPSHELEFEADPLRLSQVVSNLLTNAAKYTDPKGHIELTGIVQNDKLSLTVTDDGIGIAQEALAGIFEMFSQVDGASARSDGGLGIGLALVKGLLDLHGGSIAAHSDGAGHGSRFTVQLPLTSGVTDRCEQTGNSIAKPATRRVLVADDNKDAADALAMLLELSGHDVKVVHDGNSALSVARTFRPDVALIDIGMPDLSGYEVAQRLRREPWGVSMYLVALTGWGRDDDRQQAKVAGFDKHITKPVDPLYLDDIFAAGVQQH